MGLTRIRSMEISDANRVRAEAPDLSRAALWIRRLDEPFRSFRAFRQGLILLSFLR